MTEGHCDACIWELKDPCPECVETIQSCADQDDSNYFGDWDSPEDSVYDIDFGDPNPVAVPAGWAEMFGGKS